MSATAPHGVRRLGRVLTAPIRGVLAFIGPRPPGADVEGHPLSPDWVLGLLLFESIAVGLSRAAPYGSDFQDALFWAELPVLFLPMALRISWPGVAPGERLLLLVVLAEATFGVKLLFHPTGFAHFDEFLHAVSASDILDARRLFLPNSLLPVSPLYPGLEILTTALVNLSGLSLFAASNLVIAIVRAVFMSALFLFYRRISGSARLAGIACVGYMAGSGYVLFDSQFAYESLAIGFMAVVLWMEAEIGDMRAGTWRALPVMLVLLGALVITHHVTSYEGVALLAGVAVLQLFSWRPEVWRSALIAALGVVLIRVWSSAIGNPLTGYLGPIVLVSTQQFLHMANGGGAERQAFVAPDGSRTPFWLQMQSIAAVAVTAALLANGFLTALARSCGERSTSEGSARRSGWYALLDLCRLRWRHSRMLLLTLLSLCWPLSVVLRLTSAGWEVGNRMAALAYLGVGFVAASGIAKWWHSPRQRLAAAAASSALTIMFIGGVITGWGAPATHTGYKLEADGLSLEPMSMDTATWTRTWLGAGNRFIADRVNSILLAVYGRQDIVNGMSDPVSPIDLIIAPVVSDYEVEVLRRDRVDFMIADFRMATMRPFLGHYFDPTEPHELHDAPLDPDLLLKWDGVPGVSRVFDNGWIVIYDVRALSHEP